MAGGMKSYSGSLRRAYPPLIFLLLVVVVYQAMWCGDTTEHPTGRPVGHSLHGLNLHATSQSSREVVALPPQPTTAVSPTQQAKSPAASPFWSKLSSEELWKHSQKANELDRIRGMVAEQLDMQRSHRELQRVESAKRHAAAGRHQPPAINCQCHALSAMDQRDHWCAQQNGRGGKLSPAHVCIVPNVCLERTGRLIFVSDAEQPDANTQRRDFSISLANSVTFQAQIVFRPKNGSDPAYFSKYADPRNFNSTFAFEQGGSSPSGKPAPYTTLAILGHSANIHITHFLEPIGSLQVAVRDLMVHDSASGACAQTDLNCFYKPSLTVSNAAALDNAQLWGQHVLRVVYEDYDRKLSFRNTNGLSWGTDEELKCFHKAVLPGAFYGIWPEGSDTTSFHRQLTLYLDRQRQVQNKTAPPANKRTIVIAHRTSKRTVVDHDNFVSIVSKHAEKYGAAVQVVMFGANSFLEQAAIAEQAGILIGIHGADLTNMVFMKRGSVVTELNPLFFFENRFYELAGALGHNYMPWNCGTHECAFGGDRSRFESYINTHSAGGLRYNATDFTYTTAKDPQPFEWNWKGYIGYACKPCDRVTCCTGVRNGFYSELRESNIMIGPPEGKHAAEIRSVLDDSFNHLGWERIRP